MGVARLVVSPHPPEGGSGHETKAAARKPTFPRSNSASLPVSLEVAQTLVAVSAIASCISGPPHATSKTDNCKISIMMMVKS